MAVDAKSIPATDATTSGSPDIEHWLTERGVTFDWSPGLSLFNIDRESSLRNQARVGAPLIDEVVERYTVAMEKGDQFPPIIVYQSGKRYVVIDGNHRVAAADRAELGELDAYIVKKASPQQTSVLTYEANTRHGEPTSMVERERQALHLIELGASRGEAANLLGVKVARLEYLMNDQEATQRLGSLGYDANDFSSSHRRRMHGVRSDVVFEALAGLVKSSSMNYETLDRLLPRINAQRNEAQQLAVIAEARREMDAVIRTTAGGTIGNSNVRPLVRLTNIVNRIKDFPIDKLPSDLDQVAKDQLRTAVLDATRRLAEVAEQLGK